VNSVSRERSLDGLGDRVVATEDAGDGAGNISASLRALLGPRGRGGGGGTDAGASGLLCAGASRLGFAGGSRDGSGGGGVAAVSALGGVVVVAALSGVGAGGGVVLAWSTGRGAGRTTSTQGDDGGTGEVVLGGTVEEVADNTAVVVGVCTREGDELRRVGPAVSVTGDFDLGAGRVEFGTLEGRGDVEGDDLMADEVVSGSEVGGDLSAGRGTPHDIGLSPFAVALATFLANLEPSGLVRVELVAGNGTTGSHVGETRTSVMRPLAPVESQGRTRCSIGDESSRPSVSAAVDSWIVGALDGGPIADLADDALAVGAVGFTVDRHARDSAVCSGISGGEEGDEESEGLHCGEDRL
jgi:hypothetical protein